MKIKGLLSFHYQVSFLVALLGAVFSTSAQDLEPRLLSAAPVNLKFGVLAYGYSTGNILLDPSLPIEGITARIHSIIPGYAQTFRLFGRLARFDAVLPFSSGVWMGNVQGIDTSTQRVGFGDPLFRLGINLVGVPAMNFGEYSSFKEKFQLGFSLRVRPPLGQYNNEKFFNLGTNRWTFQTLLGASYKAGKMVFEFHLSSWFFTPNMSFYPDNELSQNPLLTLQLHLAYIFKPGLWASVSIGQNLGGNTYLNGVGQDNPQKNNRFGAAFAYPFGKKHSLKLVFTSGVVTRFGADFDSLLLAYQLRLWPGSGKKKE